MQGSYSPKNKRHPFTRMCASNVSGGKQKNLTIIDPDSLLTMPSQKAEALFNRMPLAEQASLVLMAPWEGRQQVVLLSHDASSLVQGLPVEEFFWTVKAVGPSDAIPLVRLASSEQLQFLFDLDWWRKDGLIHEKVAAWILLLFEAGEDTVASWIRWIMAKDDRLMSAVLRPFVKVTKRDDAMDMQEAVDTLPPFTLDNVYFLSFPQKGLFPLWSRFLKELYGVSPDFFRDTMETILYESSAEAVETAYHCRRSRLGDWGIPDYFDALDIYAPLPDNQVRMVDDGPSRGTDALEGIMPAFVPTLYMGRYPALRRAVEALFGTRAMERILLEWVGAANKVLVVDAVDFDDAEAQRRSLSKVAALLNLGIEASAGMEGWHPEDMLRDGVVEDFVRLGHSLARRLGSRARALISAGLVPPDLAFLRESWADLLAGLLTDRAVLWDGESGQYLPFSSMAQVAKVDQVLRVVEEWGRVMALMRPHWAVWSESIPWEETNLGNPREFSWQRAFLTALAREALGGGLKVRAIPEEGLDALRSTWFSCMDRVLDGEKGLGFQLAPGARQSCMRALESIVRQSGVDYAAVWHMVDESLAALYEEWRQLPHGGSIDGRFVSTLLVGLGESR
jgi:hypothetical protein